MRLLIYILPKGKSKGVYSSSWNSPQNYGTLLVNGITVLSATRQRWPPRLHPNRAGWYSIYRPRKDERLSWPSWLVTYRNGLPVHRRSPILVLTGSDVVQLLRNANRNSYTSFRVVPFSVTLSDLARYAVTDVCESCGFWFIHGFYASISIQKNLKGSLQPKLEWASLWALMRAISSERRSQILIT